MKQPLPVARACCQITLDWGKKQREDTYIKEGDLLLGTNEMITR